MNRETPHKPPLSALLRLLQFLRPYGWTVCGAAAALIFTAAVTLSMGQGVRLLIDDGFGGPGGGSASGLLNAVLVILLLAALMAAGTYIRFYLVSWLGERVSADLRKAVFANVVGLHPGYFEANRSGEIISRLTTDTTLLQTIIGSSMSIALRSALTLSGALVMLLVTNLQLTLMVLAGVPVILLPLLFHGRRVRRLSNRSQDSIAHAGSYAGEVIQHIRTVQGYNREGFERAAFAREVERAFAIARRRIRQRALLFAGVIFLLFGGFAAMVWSGGSDVLSGRMSPGELGAFVFYALMVGTGLAALSEVWGELQRAAGATERLLELLGERSALPEPGQSRPADATTGQAEPTSFTDSTMSNAVGRSGAAAPAAPAKVLARAARGGAAMRVEALSFAYPSRPGQFALRDLSLDIPAGESLALVGPSGAGKSTLFELLQRFHDPQSGRITLDGSDIRQFPLADLRARLATVPQAPAMFTADVAYNIGYGKPGADEAAIINAARAAHAHDFISALPQGYGSHLGEQGVRLSGGQRQRIAIARAVLKNPDILLLDEATSALDAESERQVQLALQEIMQGRTTVIIAHRLSTILHADNIAVLDQGRLIATGPHPRLLRDCPLYQRLASLQFKDEGEAETTRALSRSP